MINNLFEREKTQAQESSEKNPSSRWDSNSRPSKFEDQMLYHWATGAGSKLYVFYTSCKGLYIGDLLKIDRPPAYKTKAIYRNA